MAIVTTLMTTPLIYFIYERHQKQIEGEGKKHDFWMVCHVNDTTLATWMGNVATLFFSKNEHSAVKALTVNEITDRPSSYIFAEIERKRDETLSSKSRKKSTVFDGMKNKIEERGALFGLRVLNTSNPPVDVENFIELRDFNMAMFEIKLKAEMKKESFIGLALEQLEKTLNWDSQNAKVVSHAILNITCPVAVLLDKENTVQESLESILFVYSGHRHESYALALIKQLINEGVHVTVALKGPMLTEQLGIDASKATIMETKPDGDVEILEGISKSSFSLVVVGGDRSSKDIFSSMLVLACPLSVLIVYPPRGSAQQELTALP
jgi:hypothetical protein